MNENYKCGYCGKRFKSLIERTSCETACLKELEERADKLKANRENRIAEINALTKQRDEINKIIYEKVKSFNSDYTPIGVEYPIFDSIDDLGIVITKGIWAK